MQKQKSNITKNQENDKKIIKVAILAEEPIGWGSGKHYFPIILNDYSWVKKEKTYQFKTEYIYDKDIINGCLSKYNVLLCPGGGVGDGEAIAKGFNIFRKTRLWKKQIKKFIENGGGYIGICGGAACFTSLDTGYDKKPTSFLERLYDKSTVGMSCIKHFYRDFAFPLFYPFQKRYPEKIGATAYVFSFAAGKTKDGFVIHTGGVPVDFVVSKDNPIFSDYPHNSVRIRWWGGPGLTVPTKPDRDVKVLAYYPKDDFSENSKTKINAWIYTGGILGLIKAFLKSFNLIRKEDGKLKDVPMYTYFLAKPWKKSNKNIKLFYSGKPSITAEIYPNQNKGRIVLCTSHPEYLIWWDGSIEEVSESKNVCIGTGFHRWVDIKPLSKTIEEELTYTWWIVRRLTAWAAKIPDEKLPPIEKGKLNDKLKEIINNNIYWDGTLINQMKNI
jgi:glutamine amidotransferase-like uncharacterized protein